MYFCTDCGCIFDEPQDICPECDFVLKEKKTLDDIIVDRILRNLRRETEEIERLIEIRKARIEEEKSEIKKMEQKIEDKTNRINDTLRSFMGEIINKGLSKETKTQNSYKLVEGTIAVTKPKQVIEKDDSLNLENDLLSTYKKVEYKLDWVKLKSELEIQEGFIFKDGKPFNVEGLSVVEKPSEIKITFAKKEKN